MCTSMLWISTRAGCPSEGRLGRTWMRWPPGPKRAQRWGTVNFSGVAGRGGAGEWCVFVGGWGWGELRREAEGRLETYIGIYESQCGKTKNSAYVAREHSRYCLHCTRRDSSSSGKRQSGAGKVHTSIQQPKWTLWYHRPPKLAQPGFCIPGSARWVNNMNKTASIQTLFCPCVVSKLSLCSNTSFPLNFTQFIHHAPGSLKH